MTMKDRYPVPLILNRPPHANHALFMSAKLQFLQKVHSIELHRRPVSGTRSTMGHPVLPRSIHLNHERLALGTFLALLPEAVRIYDGREEPVRGEVDHVPEGSRIGKVIPLPGFGCPELAPYVLCVGDVRVCSGEQGVSVYCCCDQSGRRGIDECAFVVCVVMEHTVFALFDTNT